MRDFYCILIFTINLLFTGSIIAQSQSNNRNFNRNEKEIENLLYNRQDNNSTKNFPQEQLNNFLDENGKKLFNPENRKPQDTSGGDSFQEYSFTGASALDYYGYSVSSAGDVNSDGFSDFIIGAPFNDAGGTDAGRAYIYYGSYVIDYNADVILTGSTVNGKLGYSVSSAGDVNRDGYDDVIVGATGISSNTGNAFVYYGGSFMNNIADVVISGENPGDLFGNSIAHAGDVNGDGYSDVVIGAYGYSSYTGRAYAYFGAAIMDNIADLIFSSGDVGSVYGYSVASAGDVNSDGFKDIIISELEDPSNYGKAFLYYGSQNMDNTPDLTMTGATPLDFFGSSVSSAGDMNGDGYDDIIVGAYYFNSQAGASYIFFGGAGMNNTADVTLNGVAGSDIFGVTVSGAGDVNGDGYKDVLVGATMNDAGNVNSGCAYLYWGGAVVNNVPDAVFNGTGANEQFGFALANAGDINRDGYSDLLISSPYNSQTGTYAGKVWLYTNTRNYVPTTLATLTGPGGNDYFGLLSSDAGDVNGDGYGDVMVTSISFQNVYLFFGGKLMDNTVDIIFYAQSGTEAFSKSISTAGDLNNDGYSDIIIGAEEYNATFGRAYVFFGGANMNNVPDLILNAPGANAYFGSSVANAGDVNGDTFDDVIVGARGVGKAYIYFGGLSMNNVEDVVMTGSGAAFGWAVSSAGNVNGDAYSDVIVSAPYEGGSNQGKVYLYLGGAVMNNVADQTFIGGGTNCILGNSLSSAGDVNGDSFSDIILGGANPSFFIVDNVGRAELFYGGVSMDAVPDLIMRGLDAYYQFGGSVADIGDYNRDGIDDFAASAYPAKRVYIFLGGAALDNIPDITISGERVNAGIYFGMSVSSAGDVNGDGSPDIISGGYNINQFGSAYILTYSNTSSDITDEGFTGQTAGDWFGYSVASAGDVNGDGFSDVIAGGRLNDMPGIDAGRAYIYFGGNPMDYIPDVILNGASSGDQFGFSVASAGDVNADLYSDVIVGAPLNDNGGFDAGSAYVYYGGPSMDNVPDVVLTGQAAGDQFGFRVSSAGNFNGDNIGDIWSDVIVGAPYNDAAGGDAGRAYVYFGSNFMDNSVDVIYTGQAAGDIFGVSVASAGYVNGDYYGDIIIGASRNDVPGTDAGRAYIYYGAALISTTPDVILNGYAGGGDSFGYSVASAGDVNGDGYGDVVVGAYQNDQAGTDAGRAYLYYGAVSMDNTADLTYYGETNYDYFGICVASAGDVNGDGYSDMIIGAVFNDAGGGDAGRAYVYYGGSVITNIPDIILTGKSSDYFGWFVANAGDVNADGKSDQIVGAFFNSQAGSQAGKAYLYLSSYPANHCILTIKMILQAFYDPGSETMNSSDTVKINLRNYYFPYSIVDQAKAVINKINFTQKFYFTSAPSGIYYLDIRHRNSIETWNYYPVTLTRNINTNYDMTANMYIAYGNNSILVDNSPVRYAIYSGDVNQDGVVDATDALLIDNDANNFLTGYINTDVNGDYSVDATDALIVDNNSANFVSKIIP